MSEGKLTRRRFLGTSVAATAGIAMAGPRAGWAADAYRSLQASDTITVVTSSLEGLGQDYLTTLIEPDKSYWDQIFDYLVEQSPSGAYLPGLATTWSSSHGGHVWTFVIREGVKFHNGDTMTAEDVAWSYNRLMFDPQSKHPLASMAVLVASIRAEGNTVVVRTKTPQATVPVWFASTDGSDSGTVVSKNYFTKVGAAQASKSPVGTGPYKFVSSKGQQSVQLTAFLDAGRSAWQKARTPKFHNVKVIAVQEASTVVALLKTGGADIAPLAVSNLADIQQQKGLRILSSPAATYAGMIFVGYTLTPKSPFANKNLRHALSVAIDRNAIAKSVYGGKAQPSAAFYGGPHSMGYPSNLAPPKYDPALAKKLLGTSDLGSGFQLQILTYDDDTDFPMMPTLAEAIAGYYKNVGLNVKVNTMDEDAEKSMLYADKFPGQIANKNLSPATVYLRGFDNVIDMVPDTVSGFTKAGRQGSHLWNNARLPEQQHRLDAIASEFDPKKQAAMFASYDRWMAANYNDIPLLAADALFGVSSKIRSWKPIVGRSTVNNLWTLT